MNVAAGADLDGAGNTANPPADAAGPKDDAAGPGAGSAEQTAGVEPRNEQDALAQLRGESTNRQDVARSMAIMERRLKLLEQSDIRVGTMNLFNAPVEVGGDLNAGAGTGRTRRSTAEPVDPAHLADYTTAFVAPDGFAHALGVLRSTHLLVLSASVGTGRDAAMFALLKGALGDGATVFTLAATLIEDVTWSVPHPGTGYVAPDATGSRIDDAWLTRTSERLRASESFLVLCTGRLTEAVSTATRRADFVVDTLAAPDPLAVVRSRIVHLGVATEADADGLLAKWEVARIVAERPRPRFAVQVALALADALSSGQDVPTALDRLRNPLGQVDEWFSDHEKPAQIAFAVATAVLEESSYLTLSDAAVNLFEALAPEQDSPPPLRFKRRLASEQPWIELAPDGAAQVVRFRSQLLQPVVLEYAWNELDGMRPALQAWLRRMVAHPDVEVRARAATAAGMLAAQDFQHALQRYVRPWASSPSFDVRQSAAVALSVVGAAPGHTERVWNLLRQWTSDVHLTSGKRLASTAGTVAGGPLGLADPWRALKVLRDLVEEDNWTLLEPVVLSIFQLVDGGCVAEVLDALLEWTDQQDLSQPVVKGLTAFVFTAREQAIASAEVELGDWPRLLADADKHPDALSELWGRALSCRPVRDLAIEALRAWVRMVDRDGRAYPVVLDLLGRVADQGDREFERLHYHLDRWSGDEDDPSPTAGRLRNALTEP